MLKFYADFFVRACVRLERLQASIGNLEKWRTSVEHDLIMVQKECERVGFKGVAAQAQRIINRVKGTFVSSSELETAVRNTIATLLRELGDAIDHELKNRLFLQVHSDRQPWYDEEDLPLFGAEVQAEFPEAQHDIAEAGRCFALERWDACIHHLMLATEIAMRKWAKDLKIKTKAPIDLADMENILSKAKDKLDELKNRPRSRKRDAALKYLSETSAHFGFIKEAWRKHSAHGRERYDERKAKNLMNHVEAFMRVLASRPKRTNDGPDTSIVSLQRREQK